ncbi:aspartyl-tRNA amidotransferase subunit B [Edaphobacter acidisoli]|uniref:Aspartyl-tRNA amidotransferase subunit B n=1 Tax=Edaphobacter acidisoli TaxID=2040573 RepID=A0A916RWN2_9BACT|nr:GatB/YqeY domain-containing protein [Edaphobacter acidisoli]GGA70494.1 aspartyl-tRNA amidotransferase subunit B [Edaphobacter acidisoli]
MAIGEKVQADIVVAMKAREEHKLTTLRMVKSALRNKEIDKRAALTEAEEAQILTTLIKQRKDSAEQFAKGGRAELAEKELAEIKMIEEYLPKAVGEDEIRGVVAGVIAGIAAGGSKPGPKEMGSVMKAVQQKIAAEGLRADGRMVSEIVKAELAK